MFKTLCLLSVILSLFSCKTAPDKVVTNYTGIEGTWKLASITQQTTGNPPTTGEARLLQEGKGQSFAKLGLLLSLFKDQSFTLIIGNGIYTTGRWKFDEAEKKLTLIAAGQAPVVFDVVQENFGTKATVVLDDKKAGTNVFFVRSGLPLTKFAEDPYYWASNTWRIRSARPDSLAGLRNKLANLLQHYTYILKAAKDRQSRTVSFEFSQSLISIYNGGIGVLPKDEVDPIWIKTFYNEADAFKAYDMYERCLGRISFKGNSAGNWIEDDYNILVAILEGIRQGKGNP